MHDDEEDFESTDAERPNSVANAPLGTHPRSFEYLPVNQSRRVSILALLDEG